MKELSGGSCDVFVIDCFNYGLKMNVVIEVEKEQKTLSVRKKKITMQHLVFTKAGSKNTFVPTDKYNVVEKARYGEIVQDVII